MCDFESYIVPIVRKMKTNDVNFIIMVSYELLTFNHHHFASYMNFI